MQIVIDINENDYELIKEYGITTFPTVGKAVANGTPIPDNATVCDIDAIRAEIKDAYDDNRACDQEDVAYGLKVSLDIIKEHTKGDN